MIAALYIDPNGVYPTMPGVDAWDEARDAKRRERERMSNEARRARKGGT